MVGVRRVGRRWEASLRRRLGHVLPHRNCDVCRGNRGKEL